MVRVMRRKLCVRIIRINRLWRVLTMGCWGEFGGVLNFCTTSRPANPSRNNNLYRASPAETRISEEGI